MGGRRPTGTCVTCGGPCQKRSKRCMPCYWDHQETTSTDDRTCADCGKRRSRGAIRCRPCNQRRLVKLHRENLLRRKMHAVCNDCGEPCHFRAKRCRACHDANPPARPVTEDVRALMREAALQRYAHVSAKRQKAADLWRQGCTLTEIAAAVGVSANRVGVYLNDLGVRPFGAPARIKRAG